MQIIVDGEPRDMTSEEITEIEAARAPSREGLLAVVYSERERRLALGFDYDFGDVRGTHHIGTTPADMAGWDEVSKLASAAIALGSSATEIGIVTNTGPVVVTVLEWQMILVAAGQFRQPIWHRSFELSAQIAAASPSELAGIDPLSGW